MDRETQVEPIREQIDGPTGEWEESHPSYANISISRMQCSGKGLNLFGSPINHNEVISLRISSCKTSRGLNHTHYFSGKEYVEVYLSPVQFAEMITNINTTGVPCTLSFLVGEGDVSQCPEEKSSELMQQEFDNSMEETKTEILQLERTVKMLLDQTKISKSMKAKVLTVVGRLRRKLKDHFPFMASQFTRQMNKTASVAKAEVDAMIQGKIRETGMKELGMEMPETRIDTDHQITHVDELKEKLKSGEEYDGPYDNPMR